MRFLRSKKKSCVARVLLSGFPHSKNSSSFLSHYFFFFFSPSLFLSLRSLFDNRSLFPSLVFFPSPIGHGAEAKGGKKERKKEKSLFLPRLIPSSSSFSSSALPLLGRHSPETTKHLKRRSLSSKTKTFKKTAITLVNNLIKELLNLLFLQYASERVSPLR